MQRRFWRLFSLNVCVLAAILALVAPASLAQPGPPPLPDNVHVVAAGLANPRGFTWGPDGALYVAESGTPPAGFMPPAGPPPPAGSPPVINNNGRITRIVPEGARTVLASGLPVFVGPLGDTLGAASVAFIGNTLYAAIAAGPKHGHPEMAGGIYRVEGGTVTLVADTDAYNIANPPAQNVHDEASEELSNPYDMIAVGGKLYVTDGNKDVIHVVDPAAPEGSRISRLIDMSSGTHKVLTGIAQGTDGNLYVAQLTAFPFPTGAARVYRVTFGGVATEVASGVSAGTGLAVAVDGTLYVTEIGTTPGVPPFLIPPGRVVRASPDGVSDVAGPLFFPTILRWGFDGLYASNGSVASDTTGMIVRIDTPGVVPATTK